MLITFVILCILWAICMFATAVLLYARVSNPYKYNKPTIICGAIALALAIVSITLAFVGLF